MHGRAQSPSSQGDPRDPTRNPRARRRHRLRGHFRQARPAFRSAKWCSTPPSPATRKSSPIPSYARQLVTLTYPHVGNTGCTDQDDEARQVWAAGLIVRDVPRRPSNWRSQVVAAGVAAQARHRRHRRHRHPQADPPAARPRRAERRADGRRDRRRQGARSRAQVPRPEGHGPGEGSHARRLAYEWRDGQLDLDSNAFVQRRAEVSTSSPTTSASSTTSCACWPSAAAA